MQKNVDPKQDPLKAAQEALKAVQEALKAAEAAQQKTPSEEQMPELKKIKKRKWGKRLKTAAIVGLAAYLSVKGLSLIRHRPQGPINQGTNNTQVQQQSRNAKDESRIPAKGPQNIGSPAPTVTTPAPGVEKVKEQIKGATFKGPESTITVTRIDGNHYEGTLQNNTTPGNGTISGTINERGIEHNWKWGTFSGKDALILREDGNLTTPDGKGVYSRVKQK